MAKLDCDDLKAIKYQLEVTVDEIFEKRELVTKTDFSHLPTKDDLFLQTQKILKSIDYLKLSF